MNEFVNKMQDATKTLPNGKGVTKRGIFYKKLKLFFCLFGLVE
jgi:hypothetical protein